MLELIAPTQYAEYIAGELAPINAINLEKENQQLIALLSRMTANAEALIEQRDEAEARTETLEAIIKADK
jgi:hypothetical protein